MRGVDETLKLARKDIRTATTLLDARRVAGDASIVDELVRGGRRKIFEPALGEFLDSLNEDTERRHERFAIFAARPAQGPRLGSSSSLASEARRLSWP